MYVNLKCNVFCSGIPVKIWHFSIKVCKKLPVVGYACNGLFVFTEVEK